MCESMEPTVSVFYFYLETWLQLTLARDFKEDVQIGKNIMSPLCYVQSQGHTKSRLLFSLQKLFPPSISWPFDLSACL